MSRRPSSAALGLNALGANNATDKGLSKRYKELSGKYNSTNDCIFNFNEEFEIDISSFTKGALMKMVDFYVKNENMKSATASSGPRASSIAHDAQIAYEESLKLNNLPTLKFEVYGGNPRPESAAPLESASVDDGSNSKVFSRARRPVLQRGGSRAGITGSGREGDLVDPKDQAGSKEWAAQLTPHQLSLLTTKQLKLLAQGRLFSMDNTVTSYLEKDGEGPDRGQFLGYCELTPAMYVCVSVCLCVSNCFGILSCVIPLCLFLSHTLTL